MDDCLIKQWIEAGNGDRHSVWSIFISLMWGNKVDEDGTVLLIGIVFKLGLIELDCVYSSPFWVGYDYPRPVHRDFWLYFRHYHFVLTLI